MLNFTQRIQELSISFKQGINTVFEDNKYRVRFYPFESRSVKQLRDVDMLTYISDDVPENFHFSYPVFIPGKKKKFSEFILLFHGLNERYWNKYLPWAEKLCLQTGKPVILFPMAYHQNRSPKNWTNPGFLKHFMDIRRQESGADKSLTFANLALSERLSNQPLRFYNSGRQTYEDIVVLLKQIKSGRHPLFEANAKADIFAYSIGALLSQILIMSNPENLLNDARLFMFCGGSVFDKMSGESRFIMDKKSFDKLLHYYQHDFISLYQQERIEDPVLDYFFMMLSGKNNPLNRTGFFREHKDSIQGISLALDTVIPYRGVVEALGHENAPGLISLLDFPYEYTHENPFPVYQHAGSQHVNKAFDQVFDQAGEFLKY
jgi:hypothetical protein